MATSPITPPPGYEVEQEQAGPTPPPGYALEQEEGQQPPAQQPSNTPTAQMGNVLKGAGSEAVGMLKGAVNNFFPGEDDAESKAKSIPPIFHAYEQARQSGKGIIDSVSAANDEAGRQSKAHDMLDQRVKEFHDNPDQASGRLIMDMLPFMFGKAGGGAEAAEGAEGKFGASSSLEKMQESAPKDAHPVKLVYDKDGNVLDLDGRHRVMQAIDDGKETIAVETKLRDGTTHTLHVDPKVVAKKFGVTRSSLAATDEAQPYRAGGGKPRAAVAAQ